MKKLNLLVLALPIVVLVLASCNGGWNKPTPPVTLTLSPKQSNESGSATLTQTSDYKQTTVTINVSGEPANETQYAFFQYGSCDNLTPSPLYPLTNVVHGKSPTTYDFPLLTLKAEGPGDGGGRGPGGPGVVGSADAGSAPTHFAITIYRYTTAGSTLLACGDNAIGSTG